MGLIAGFSAGVSAAVISLILCSYMPLLEQNGGQSETVFISDPKRLSAEEMNKRVRKRVEPLFPPSAIDIGNVLRKKLAVEVVVSEEGDVVSAKAVSGVSFMKDLAVEAVRAWKFFPPKSEGVSQIVGVIVFEPPLETLYGRMRRDISYYQELVKSEPQSWEARCKLATAYQERDLNREAVNEFKQAILLSPQLPFAYFGLGKAYSRLNQYDQALEAYQQAVRVKPDFVEAYFGVGHMYERLAGLDDRYVLHEGLRLSGEATGWRDHGLITKTPVKKPEKVNFEKIEKAVEAFKQAIKVRPEPDVKDVAFSNIAEIYSNTGRIEQAIEAYKEFIKIRLENKKYDPSWNDEKFVAKDVNILAVICEEDGRYEEAIRHFQRSIELAQFTSTYFEAYWKIVTLYKKLGKEAEAMRAGRKMLEETERYLKSGASRDVRGEIYEERGLIYEAMGLYKEAIESYKRAADLLRDWVTPHASLYQLYRKMGDKEAAERELTIVKRMNREEYERLMQPLKEPHRIIKIK